MSEEAYIGAKQQKLLQLNSLQVALNEILSAQHQCLLMVIPSNTHTHTHIQENTFSI